MVKSMGRGIIKEMELKKNLISMMGSFLHLKKTIAPLLISVSIFSLVFSWSSLSSLVLLHYQNLHHFYLLSTSMNKNCIFLIFNGILVFLATLLRPPPSEPDLEKSVNKRVVDELQETETLSDKHVALDENFGSAENDVQEEEDDDEETKMREVLKERMEEVVDEELNKGAVQALISIEDEDEDEDQEEEEEKEKEEVDDEIEKLSNEELNKKFEDFIKRVKEEFKINNQYQQQQLVLVK